MVEQLEQPVFPNAGYIVLAAGHRARELDELASQKLYEDNDATAAHQLQQAKAGLVIDCARQMRAYEQQGGYVGPAVPDVLDAIASSAQAALDEDDYFAMAVLLKPRGCRRSDPNNLERVAKLHFDLPEGTSPLSLPAAIDLATAAHFNVADQGNGSPYINHPLRVMRALEPYGPEVQITAVLHDTVEDCPWVTLQLLRELGAPEQIIQAVDALTKRDEEDYHQGLIMRAKANPVGKLVKLADNLENSNEARLANFTPKDAQRRRQKYSLALRILTADDPWLAQQVETIKAAIESQYEAEAA